MTQLVDLCEAYDFLSVYVLYGLQQCGPCQRRDSSKQEVMSSLTWNQEDDYGIKTVGYGAFYYLCYV